MYKIIKQHPVITFFIVTLLWSDGWWIFGRNFSLSAWLGLIGPGLWAIILTAKLYGFSGMRNLFKPLFKWRTGPIYYLLVFVGTFCLLAAITIISAKLLQKTNISILPFLFTTPLWRTLLIIFMAIVFSILYEEIGWRGFALPKLTNKINGLNVSLILGGIWILWHLPLIYSRDPNISISALIAYSIYLMSMAFIFNWFYFKTKGSLLIVGILHGTLDAYQLLFFSSLSSASGVPNNIVIFTTIFIAILMIPFLWQQAALRK